MTERKSDKPAVIIAVALLAIILIGEVIVYTSDYTDYSAEAELEGDSLGYQVSADGSKTYSVVVNDNGTYDGIDRLYIYFDESYPANYEDVDVSIGAQALDQEYYLEQVVNLLKPRNFHDITYVDAEQLADALAGDLASDGCGTAGLLVISGALPDTVYTGNADDTIFQWMSEGGSLYWLGNLIGECYATADGLRHVENYQELKEKLLRHGYAFYSQTDTEVLIKLVDYYYKKYRMGPIDAITKTMVRVRGSYALEVMFKDYPGEIYTARKDSPMIIGIAGGETYVASDVPAILKYTRNVYYIGNRELARLTPGKAVFYDLNGDEVEKEPIEITFSAEAAEKGGFKHFILKNENRLTTIPRAMSCYTCYSSSFCV